MILEREVEIIVSSKKIDYWKSKGYFVPRYKDKFSRYKVKRGTKILVKVEDLLPNSKFIVHRQCDDCGTVIKLRYCDARDICLKCARKLKRGENSYNWVGGWYNNLPVCITCGKQLKHKESKLCKNCFYEQNRGENNSNWNPNLTDEDRKIGRRLGGLGRWIRLVKERDNQSCQCCSSKEKICAHHIDNWGDNEDKRLDLDNGVCLCENCHHKFHKKYGNKNTTKRQLINFLINNLYETNKEAIYNIKEYQNENSKN